MKIVKGKIVSATKTELYEYYLQRDLDDVYSFPDYIARMKHAGVKVAEDD